MTAKPYDFFSGTQEDINRKLLRRILKLEQGGGGTGIVEDFLSTTSKNPVQNKIITTALNNKLDSNSAPTKTSDLVNDGANGIKPFIDDISSKEDVLNKQSSWNNPTSDTHYPSEKLVKDSLDLKEDLSNKVTSWSSTVSDANYPSVLFTLLVLV